MQLDALVERMRCDLQEPTPLGEKPNPTPTESSSVDDGFGDADRACKQKTAGSTSKALVGRVETQNPTQSWLCQ